ncbi:MAG TPA: cytochrome c oxidase subunit 4 [Candidatus Dormibacteraeota bacterium]|nr:cytochrome c oxidase subunit 4 [Candidatus Dormibacteraeota bacterium]
MAEPEHDAHAEGHEAFHLPPPSIWPAVLALGIALLLTGLILNLVIVAIGAVITIAAIALWVRDARREFAELPD